MTLIQKFVAACSILIVTSAGVARSGQVDTLLNPQLSRNVLRQTGIELYSEGKYAEAIKSLLLIQGDSVTSAVKFYLGLSYAAMNDLERAKDLLKSAVDADSLNVGYRFHYAQILAQSGDPNSARREYEFISKKDTSFIPSYWQLGLLLYDQKMYKEAIDIFSHLVAVNPRDFSSYYYLGSALSFLKRIDSARLTLAACLTINPGYFPALTALAALYYDDHEYREALRLYSKASAQVPGNGELFYRIGICETHMEEYSSAIAAFRQAVQRDSMKDIYYAQLGYGYLLEKKFDSAAAAYQKALTLEQDNPLYYVNLALALSQTNRVEDAVDAYRRALVAYHPENIADVYVRLGSLYFVQKQYRNALIAYQQAADYQPLNKEAQFYAALTLDQLKDSPSALRQYRKYLKLVADDTTRQERERKHQAKGRIENLKNK